VGRYAAIQEEAYESSLLLPKYKLIDLTFGNVSVIDRAAGVFAIKPSGVDYHGLTAGDMVVVDLEGKIVEGKLRPSSDTPTHLEIYRSFATVGGVAHTHSTWASSWAQAHRSVPCFGTTHADYFRGPVPCSRDLTPEEVAGAYEKETGRVIVETFEALDPDEVPAVLVASHGVFTWGRDASRAVLHAAVVEQVARMAQLSLELSPKLGEISPQLLDRHFLRKHGSHAYYGQVSSP